MVYADSLADSLADQVGVNDVADEAGQEVMSG